MTHVKVKYLLTDSGGEFYCREFEDYMNSIGCHHYSIGSGSSGKVPHLDRITRYLQERMAAYFTSKETSNWVKVLPQLISSQNRTFSSAIQKTPKEAWDKRRDYIEKEDVSVPTRERDKFKVGQWVSLLGTELGSMSHAYRGQWTLPKYKIFKIKRHQPDRLMYYVEDELGEKLKEGFYSNELTSSRFKDSKRIDKVMKRKTINGEKWALVRYKRRDKRFDAWIKESDLVSIAKVSIKRKKKR